MKLIITIPKKIKWGDYEKEIETVKDGSQMMLFRVPFKPKHDLIGERCYICGSSASGDHSGTGERYAAVGRKRS